jgi:hypothetical protein
MYVEHEQPKSAIAPGKYKKSRGGKDVNVGQKQKRKKLKKIKG